MNLDFCTSTGMLLWLLLLSLRLFGAQGSVNITGRVLEESQAQTSVLDVRQELAELQRRQNASVGARPIAEVRMDEDDYFYLNDGLLLVKRRLDYETLCAQRDSCFLHVRLFVRYEQSAHGDFDTVHAYVQLRDLNDHTPTFERDASDADFQVSIEEHVPKGSKYRLPSASDPDTGANGMLTYFIQSFGNTSEPIGRVFAVQNLRADKQADLIVLADLDRETRASYLLNLTVCDSGSPAKRCVWRKVTVMIADVNDHAPVLLNASYVLHVREDAIVPVVLTRVVAIDRDFGHFGQLQFKIDPVRSTAAALQLFAVGLSSGVVQLVAPLDREKMQLHKITINVFDSPKDAQHSRTTTCSVIVNVIDVNDQAPAVKVIPMFDASDFSELHATNGYSDGLQTLPVFENTVPDTVLALLHVSDGDADANGQVQCHVEEARSFRLVQTSTSPSAVEYQLIARHSFDYEQQTLHTVHVECTDKAQQPKRTLQVINVHVVDRNDNPPRFRSSFNSSATLRVSVPENNAPNDALLRIEIADNDTDKSNLLHVVQLLSHQDLFYVTNASSPYAVTLHARTSLDREMVAYYNLTLAMSDKTCECTHDVSTLHLTLQVSDVNDNAPVLLTKNATVSRNASRGVLATLLATDADTGNTQLHFSLVSAEFAKPTVQVTADGRVLLLEGQLDRKGPNCMLVRVHDGGQPPMQSTSRVCLLANVNEHAPTWRFPSRHDTINVTLPRSAVRLDLQAIEIARLDAHDADDVKSVLQYSLRSSQQYVELDGARLLLRRVPPIGDDQLVTLSLALEVTDDGQPPRSSSATLHVNFWLDDTNNIFSQLRLAPSDVRQTSVWIILLTALVSVVLLAIVAGLLVHCYLTRRARPPKTTATPDPAHVHDRPFVVPRMDAATAVVCRLESGDESDYSVRKHATSSYFECDCNSYNSPYAHEQPTQAGRPTEADSLLSSLKHDQNDGGECESTLGSNQLQLVDMPSDNNESGISLWDSRTRCPRVRLPLPSPDDVTVVFNDPTLDRAKVKRKKRAKMLAVNANSRIIASRKTSSASGTLDSGMLTASASASWTLRAAPVRLNTTCTPSSWCTASPRLQGDHALAKCCQPALPCNLSAVARHTAVQLQPHYKQTSPSSVCVPSGDMMALMSRRRQPLALAPDKKVAALETSTADFSHHKNYSNTPSLATSLI